MKTRNSSQMSSQAQGAPAYSWALLCHVRGVNRPMISKAEEQMLMWDTLMMMMKMIEPGMMQRHGAEENKTNNDCQ